MLQNMAFAEVSLEFRYKAGKLNVPADNLSCPGSGALDQSMRNEKDLNSLCV